MIYGGCGSYKGFIALSGANYLPYERYENGTQEAGTKYTEIISSREIKGWAIEYPVLYPSTGGWGGTTIFGGNTMRSLSYRQIATEGSANFVSPTYREYPSTIYIPHPITCLSEWESEQDQIAILRISGGKATTTYPGYPDDFKRLIKIFRVDANGNEIQKCPPPNGNNQETFPETRLEELSPQGKLTDEDECPPGQVMCLSDCPDGFCCVEDCS